MENKVQGGDTIKTEGDHESDIPIKDECGAGEEDGDQDEVSSSEDSSSSDSSDGESSSSEEEITYYITMDDVMNEGKEGLADVLGQHDEDMEKVSKELHCEKCDKTYSNENGLKSHMKKKHLYGDFSCKVCQIFFTNFALEYLDHFQTKHSDHHDFKCPGCEETNFGLTKDEITKNFQDHYQLNHTRASGKRHQSSTEICDVCGVTLQTKGALMQHLNLHTGIKPYKCDECDFKTCHKTSLSLHLKKHRREKGVEDHICHTCGKSFNSNFALREHILIIHEGKKDRHECKTCGMTFTWISTLARHNAKVHKTKNKEETTCKICGYITSFKNELKKHERAHKEGEFTCRFCGKVLKHLSTFEAHERIHTGENPYLCNRCDFRCRSATILWRHRVEKHNERKRDDTEVSISSRKEKTYKCDVCGKNYTRTDGLRDHMNTHLGLKPHKCQICDYASSHRAGLFMHMKKHRK